jgi:hypothetical protein
MEVYDSKQFEGDIARHQGPAVMNAMTTDMTVVTHLTSLKVASYLMSRQRTRVSSYSMGLFWWGGLKK